MDPKSKLEHFKVGFDIELQKYLLSKEEEYKEISPFIYDFFKNISEFTLRGGKRLRPALLNCAYLLFGGDKKDEITKLSVFVELIQSYLLIHDDIFDNSDTRRKGPTFHKIYENYSINNGWQDSSHFGISLGVLGGDVALQLVNDIITKSDFLDGRKNRVLGLVTKLTTDVLIGQIQDFILPFKEMYSEADIAQIHFYKTATYTFYMPLLSGAYLAGMEDNDENIVYLKEYAKFAGMAFQVRDDILGVFGDEEKTGKPSVSDIKEGKKTLLILKAEENANESDLSTIKSLLGKKSLTDEEAEEFRNIIIRTGSLDYSKAKSEEYVTHAKNLLEKIKIRNEQWEFLNELANYLILRDI